VFTPIENWLNDNVWQYLVQVPNPWGHSNKDLLAMYSGALLLTVKCLLLLIPLRPAVATGRFGCWVVTMVTEDKSMAAMIQNDEEKAWMLPMLEFRNEIAGYGDWQTDRVIVETSVKDDGRSSSGITIALFMALTQKRDS
jgi:DNA sulfur modification protein DndC